MAYDVIDLFAGAGGFCLGLSTAGASSAFTAVEQDGDCAETLRMNFSEAEIIVADVRDVDFARMNADVVVGGPPCQGFSTLNRGRENDPRNGLAAEMLRCVATVGPKFVVLENVPGFLKAAEGQHVLDELARLDYSVRGEVVNAADYGVPQRRKRAIVVAAAGGYPLPWPRPTHSSKGSQLPTHRTVGDAFAMLPALPDGKNWHRDPGRDPAVHLPRFRAVKEGGARSDLPADLVLDCWKGADGYRDVLGRLEWQRPATTVRTEFFRPEKGRFLHPRADRPISPREAARLQSFPDSFSFPEDHTLTSVGRQIGNAMPPALAESIGRAIADCIGLGQRSKRKRRVAV